MAQKGGNYVEETEEEKAAEMRATLKGQLENVNAHVVHVSPKRL
jgi:hypothetical protein